MGESLQFSMHESRFIPKVLLGCIRLQHADELPLDGANFSSNAGKVTLALDGATGKPGLFDSSVAIHTFQFPDGLAELERLVEWFGEDRKTRAKLPDGCQFDETVLAVPDAPSDWEHDAYPQSKRAFVHVYRGKDQAVLVRWIARTGTILDHPLFRPLVDNLRIVPGQWIMEPPEIRPAPRQRDVVTATPLTDELRTEIEASAARARKTLQLTDDLRPMQIAEAVYNAIDEFRSRKGMKKNRKQDFATEVGSLWGQTLCQATGWQWQRLEDDEGEQAFAVCSPNGSNAVLPLNAIYNLVTHPKSENNSLLLFNMIRAGKMPIGSEGAYSLLW